ncbi:MAG: hypothetical protein IKU37_02200 [Candidatus Gastranaerophilales bacterium]|nr:hypothetical protein [Candidatus Gastranaerophilales bacterium]
MKINPITSYSFKNLTKNKPASNNVTPVTIGGYKVEFYNPDGSFKESVELKNTKEGNFFVLNEDKQGKNFYSISIPYDLYPVESFKGAVIATKFCYLTKIKDGKEELRILIGNDKALPLYCDDNGSIKESKISHEDLAKYRHLAEVARSLPNVPYDYFNTARISLNILEENLPIED